MNRVAKSFSVKYTEALKYQTIIENAQKADGIIREKVASQKEGIDMLSMSEPQLKSAIPSASPIAALKDNPVCDV